MRGHIIKRKGQKNSDHWTLIVDLPSDNGKRKQHWETVKGTRKEAQKRLNEILRQLDTGAFVKPDRMTVGQYLTEWIRDYVEPNRSPGTTDGYRDIVRAHLIPELGAIRLHELKPEHIQAYYTRLLKSGRIRGGGGLCPKTIKNHHRLLSKALNEAVEQGRLMRNVALAVKPPRCEHKEMACLSPEEVKHFLELAKDTPFYVLFYTAIYTGLRRGEILGLRWKDIDVDLLSLSVQRTLQHIPKAGYVIKEPKTKQSRRFVDLPTSLAIMLREYKQEQELTFKNLWGYTITPDDLVFCTTDGKPLPPNGVTKAFRDLAKKAGYRGVRFHDLRHTYATIMMGLGIHPKVVSMALGHTSIMTTLDLYSHKIPGLGASAAQRFEEALRRAEGAMEGAR